VSSLPLFPRLMELHRGTFLEQPIQIGFERRLKLHGDSETKQFRIRHPAEAPAKEFDVDVACREAHSGGSSLVGVSDHGQHPCRH
jgi:hypothetical protein